MQEIFYIVHKNSIEICVFNELLLIEKCGCFYKSQGEANFSKNKTLAKDARTVKVKIITSKHHVKIIYLSIKKTSLKSKLPI